MRRGPVVVVVLCAALLSAGWLLAHAQPAAKKKLTLERIYQYPRLEGTAPTRAKWSEDGRKLAFLWNDKGMPFHDLWVYDVDTRNFTHLTDLKQPRDFWTPSRAEKDPKLKKYLPPEGGLGAFEWAKDSRKLAFSFRGELYVVRADGSKPLRLTRTRGAESGPKFSPDSQKLAYTAGRELWALDLKTGQRTQLTSGSTEDLLNGSPPFGRGSWRGFDWSPDGYWLAFLQVDRTGTPTRLIPSYSGVTVRARKQRRTFAKDETLKIRLGVVPAAGGETLWLTKAERQYFYDWRWSPDSTRIVINRVEENWKKRHLDVVDVAHAVKEAKEAKEAREKKRAKDAEQEEKYEWVRTLYTETDDKWICTLCTPVAWNPEGDWILFLSERDGWNHLYLIRAESRRPVTVVAGRASALNPRSVRQLTTGPWEVETRGTPASMRPRFSRDGRRVYFTANREDPSTRDLYWVETAGGEPYRLTERTGYNVALVSPDDRHLALLYSSFAVPWDLYVRTNAQGEAWERVTTSPLPEFNEYEWPQPEIVEFPAPDKKSVRALLFPPSEIGVDALKTVRLPGPPARRRDKRGGPRVRKVPVVNFVHGAGYAQAVLNRWGGYFTPRFQFNQYLAQHGYAVIDVDYRGSSGYGRDWRTDVYLHLGGKDLEDELAAMDYLKTLGWVDTDRAGVWGVSYGGFMTLMAMFLSPDTFQAGSAWAAVTDWANYNRHYTQQRLRTPDEEPEAYQRSSPLHHVAGLKNHLQVQHGVVDSNVHFQDAVQLIDALVAADKEFDLVLYPQSNHGWSRPRVWIHSTRKMFDFFEQNLKGD
ncbi:MAG: prolyl oligopeptidase family serine peptidase [Terriglobia bacterium]